MTRGIVRRTTTVAALGLVALLAACGGGGEAPRDIAAVVEAHADELVAIDGVSAVAVGKLSRGRPCVRIYVAELTDELRAQLPTELEGFPVDIEVSGEFAPVEKPADPEKP